MILVDSREQKCEHVTAAFDNLGIRYDRTKLYVGDYSLPYNQSVCVDRKAGLQEVYSNVIQQHDRFRREVCRAMNAGIHLIVLVEDPWIEELDQVAEWKNNRITHWDFVNRMHRNGKMLDTKISDRPPVPSDRLMAAMRSMALKYGIEWQFVTHKLCGQRIAEILGEVKADERGA